MVRYVSGKKASSILGVHQRTLYHWELTNNIETIRTPGGKRLYNVDDYITKHSKHYLLNMDDTNIANNKLNICYARVSSKSQKNDLIRQQLLLTSIYPTHKLIVDIGSGINFNRIGLRKIIDLAISGKINELVIAYKDRLTRFGYDLIDDLIKKYSNGKIIIINNQDYIKPEDELVRDVLQLMNVFVARMNGLRKYKKIEMV